ncbi:MAG: phosphoribosylaminoimidazolesuccinocarboxamide synthase [Chloroflexi bacterium]|nr:phosphoribosylaminoimidazolesuccinocarboxamide synthase [Chloroflexota bacterium]
MLHSSLPLPIFCKGKVRDTYDLGVNLLIVATDRISAFDVVLPCAIPFKGNVLNQLSAFWFSMTSKLIPNHLVRVVDSLQSLPVALSGITPAPSFLIGRSMVVRKARLIPVECVVRGYISGSAWSEYQEQGTTYGIELPRGLRESETLAAPIFTPTTKAETGHDMPLTRKEMAGLIGESLSDELESRAKEVYSFAAEYALSKGIIIADTKMEFGKMDDKVILIDELLTPDSSRFWEVSQYQVGRGQPSLDKQPLRDWLVEQGWNKQPPAPVVSQLVIKETSERYLKAYKRLTGKKIEA